MNLRNIEPKIRKVDSGVIKEFIFPDLIRREIHPEKGKFIIDPKHLCEFNYQRVIRPTKKSKVIVGYVDNAFNLLSSVEELEADKYYPMDPFVPHHARFSGGPTEIYYANIGGGKIVKDLGYSVLDNMVM